MKRLLFPIIVGTILLACMPASAFNPGSLIEKPSSHNLECSLLHIVGRPKRTAKSVTEAKVPLLDIPKQFLPKEMFSCNAITGWICIFSCGSTPGASEPWAGQSIAPTSIPYYNESCQSACSSVRLYRYEFLRWEFTYVEEYVIDNTLYEDGNSIFYANESGNITNSVESYGEFTNSDNCIREVTFTKVEAVWNKIGNLQPDCYHTYPDPDEPEEVKIEAGWEEDENIARLSAGPGSILPWHLILEVTGESLQGEW
jgi:hypothetical protein